MEAHILQIGAGHPLLIQGSCLVGKESAFLDCGGDARCPFKLLFIYRCMDPSSSLWPMPTVPIICRRGHGDGERRLLVDSSVQALNMFLLFMNFELMLKGLGMCLYHHPSLLLPTLHKNLYT